MDFEKGDGCINGEAAMPDGTKAGRRNGRVDRETCHRIRKRIEVVAECAMVLVVWILLSLPVVFHFVGREEVCHTIIQFQVRPRS